MRFINHRSSFYFLVTAISHVISGGPNDEIVRLKPMIASIFALIKTAFSKETRNVLQDAIFNLSGTEIDGESSEPTAKLIIDVTALSFSCKMENSQSIEAKLFFTNLWQALKKGRKVNYKDPRSGGKYKLISNHIITHYEEFMNTNASISQLSFRKLYQMAFLDLLFREKVSLEELIARYAEFRQDFFGVIIDNRYRLLNKSDILNLMR